MVFSSNKTDEIVDSVYLWWICYNKFNSHDKLGQIHISRFEAYFWPLFYHYFIHRSFTKGEKFSVSQSIFMRFILTKLQTPILQQLLTYDRSIHFSGEIKEDINKKVYDISDVMLPPNVSHSLSNHRNRKASSLTWRKLWNRCCWNSNWIGALCCVLYRLMIRLWFSCHLQPVL